jgi:hypothetical protein
MKRPFNFICTDEEWDKIYARNEERRQKYWFEEEKKETPEPEVAINTASLYTMTIDAFLKKHNTEYTTHQLLVKAKVDIADNILGNWTIWREVIKGIEHSSSFTTIDYGMDHLLNCLVDKRENNHYKRWRNKQSIAMTKSNLSRALLPEIIGLIHEYYLLLVAKTTKSNIEPYAREVFFCGVFFHGGQIQFNKEFLKVSKWIRGEERRKNQEFNKKVKHELLRRWQD